MAGVDTYSRLVGFAKLVLPLIALGILSTVFLVAEGVNPDDAIPYAEFDVEVAAREQRLTNARYATVGEDGAVIELSAVEARPDPEDAARATATSINGRVVLPSGTELTLTSGGAMIDTKLQVAGLTEDVGLVTSTGIEVKTAQLTVRLDRGEVGSQSDVDVQTPFGSLHAGNMLLTRDEGDENSYRLRFNDQVRLLYVPKP